MSRVGLAGDPIEPHMQATFPAHIQGGKFGHRDGSRAVAHVGRCGIFGFRFGLGLGLGFGRSATVARITRPVP